MLLGCYQLLWRPKQFQLKLHTEERRKRAIGMTWPEQPSCSQQWIKLSVSWITQDVCSCLITTQCLFYSILYPEEKRYLFISHHFHAMGFSVCCYGNLPFPFTIIQIHTWAEMEYASINNSFQNLVCKMSIGILVQWGRTILDAVLVNHGSIQKLFRIPFVQRLMVLEDEDIYLDTQHLL